MTYQQLLEALQALTPEQLAMDVTIADPHCEDEFHGGAFAVNLESSVLDFYHPYFAVTGDEN